MRVQYLNTDFVIESRNELSELVKWLADDELGVLGASEHQGIYRASFEFMTHGAEPDQLITEYCERFESLPKQLKTVWESCFSKVFDIGVAYEENSNSGGYSALLRPDTIRRISALGCGVVFTVYPK